MNWLGEAKQDNEMAMATSHAFVFVFNVFNMLPPSIGNGQLIKGTSGVQYARIMKIANVEPLK